MTKRKDLPAAVSGSRAIDLTGKRFGAWTVLHRIPGSRSLAMCWMCRCDCGNVIAVNSQSLRDGRSTQCIECGHQATSAALLQDIEERFWRFVYPEPNSGCWLWIGACHRTGYGQFRIDQKILVPATHIALALYADGIQRGMHACHKCDNPPCVNPEHLFGGTAKDNMRDMIKKGRANYSGLAIGHAIAAERARSARSKR